MDFPIATGKPVPEALGTSLVAIDMSVRTANCLCNTGCAVMADVAMLSEAEIFMRKNIGRKSVREIVSVLKEHHIMPATLPAVALLQATAEDIGIDIGIRTGIARNMTCEINPSVLALVLFPKARLALMPNEEHAVNRALSAHHSSLRLGMHIHDLFVEQRELTPDQLAFLAQDIAALDLPNAVRDELLAVDAGSWVGQIYLIARLPGYPHRELLERRFRGYDLSLDTPIAAQEFLRIRQP